MEIITGFNYQALDAETRIVLQQRAVDIKSLVRRSVSDVVEVGIKLAEVRDKLSHNKQGGFKGWLQTEFTWSYETALNYIRVSDWAANNVNFTELDIAPSALYLLAGPSIPNEARQEAIDRAESGERITHKKARVITGGISKRTIKPKIADTGPKKESQINRSAPLVESQEPELPPTYKLELACDESTWRLIKRTFNDPVWAAQVLAAAASLDEREVAEALGIERVVDW